MGFTSDYLAHTKGPLDINSNPRTGKPYFNTSLFSLQPLGQPGTAARRFFYGPGINNFDLAVLKTVRLTESKSLEFRLGFNAFNRAQFYGAAAVDGNISSAAFGQVVSAALPESSRQQPSFISEGYRPIWGLVWGRCSQPWLPRALGYTSLKRDQGRFRTGR